MSIKRVTKAALKTVEVIFSMVLSPFAKSNSLESYSNRGYVLLAFLIAAPTFILWWCGFLSRPLSHSHPIIRGMYAGLAEKSGIFAYIPDSYVSFLVVPAICYLVIAPWSSPRRIIGEATANSFFWSVDRGIALGEWFIEHRWWSFSLIIVLSFVLALLIGQEIQRLSNTRRLRNDFEYWRADAKDFIRYNTVTKAEPRRYTRVQSYWRDDFRDILDMPDGSTHPALCLNQMLKDLYASPPEKTWYSVLELKIHRIESDMEKCRSRSPHNIDSELEIRAVMNLLLGRIHVRLAQNPANQLTSSDNDLLIAMAYFDAVEQLLSSKTGVYQSLRADATNGKGTVFGNAFSSYTRGYIRPLSSERLSNLRQLCQNPAQCAMQALNSYEEAGKGFASCSFEDKRRINNIADLLLRIGQNYDAVAGDLNAHPFLNWMQTPYQLSEEIERRMGELMECNRAEPFLSTFALTAAQGFAVAAKLKAQAGYSADREISASGHYLRLANSFEPQNVSQWEYSYFCFFVTKDGINEQFNNALSTTFDGLPDANHLLEIVKKKCR